MDRAGLIERLSRQGAFSPRILSAVAEVDRALFVPPELQSEAWEDRALPIGLGQTVSQPFIVAMMSQALGLEGHERVLEVGTGSGYQTAVLSRLCREVASIELLPELEALALSRLASLGIGNVRFRCGDGARGWPELAPFDGIMVTAAPGAIPQPLIEQLSTGGRLVIPVGPQGGDQRLLRVEREGELGGYQTQELGAVRFVPLV